MFALLTETGATAGIEAPRPGFPATLPRAQIKALRVAPAVGNDPEQTFHRDQDHGSLASPFGTWGASDGWPP
jgi:hypothetical protein